MAQLTNQYVSQSYQGLIKLADSTTGVTGTLQYTQDGVGNNLPIQISTSSVNITGSFTINGQPISINTGSFATTGSNIFVGDQTITGSNGYLIYDGSMNVDTSLASIHANDATPWLERFYNDTFSDTNSVMSYFGWDDGRFIFHNDSTQSISISVNGYDNDNLLVGDTYTISNNDLIVSGAIKTNGAITFSNSAFNSLTEPSGALYFSTLNNGTLHLNDDGGEGDVFIGWGPNNTHIKGNTDITGSLGVTNIKGTGSLFLQPNQSDARFLEVYNTSPTDTHITASGGQLFVGNDLTYVKVDNYGSVNRIDIVAGNELVVSSSVINVTGSLHQKGTFYPDVIDWVDSSIQLGTGSYVLTTNVSGVTQYDSYQNIATALQPYINTGSLNSYTTTSSFNSYTSSNDGRVSSLENKTGSYATTGSNTFNGTQTITGSVDITGTVTAASASFIYLTTVYETSSVLFSSGSNILGDASNDTQTLWGTVKIPTGPVSITGSVEISGSIRQNTPYSGTGTNTAVTNSFIGNTQITGSGNGVNALKVSGSISATNKITAGVSRSGSASNGNMLVQGLHAYFEALSISESIMLVESFDDAGTYDITFRVDANPTGVYFKDYDNGTAQAYTSWMTMGPNVNSNPSPQFLRSVGITGSLGVTGGITGSLQGTSSYATQALSASYAPSNPLPSGLVSGSSQIIYSGLTGIPSGIISGSAQLPSGLVSSSAQVAEYGYATTGSNTFIGNEIISGSLTVTGSIKQTIPFIGTGTNAAVTNSFIGNTYITGSGTGGNALKVSGSGTFTRKVTVGDSSALRQSQFGQLDVAGLNPYLGVFGSGSSKLVTEVYDDASTYDVALNQYSTPSGSGFADWDQSGFTYVPFMTLGTNVGTNPAPQFKRSVGITGSLFVSNVPSGSTSSNYVTWNSSTQQLEYTSGSGGGSVPAGTVSGSAQIAAFGYAITGSNQFNGNQSISGSLVVSSSLKASGLNYPTVDGLAGQVIETDASGNLSFDDVHTLLEDIRSGEAITKGDPLYISGSQGATPIVYRADASNAAKMPVTYVALDTVGSNTNTRGIVLGLIEGMNLTGYNAGDDVYVAEGGGWSTSRPSGSASITQLLGVVTKGGAGGKGMVLNPGPATLPTLPTGKLWIGNASNQPVTQSISEIGIATTGSNRFAGDQTITGSLTVSGSINNVVISGSVRQTIPFIGTGTNAAVTNSFIGNTEITGSGTGANALRVSGSGTFTRALFAGTSRSGSFGTIQARGLASSVAALSVSSSIMDFECYDDAGTYDVALQMGSIPTQIYFQDWDNGTGQTYVKWLTMAPNVNNNPAPQFLRSVGITGSLSVTGTIYGDGSGISGVTATLPAGVVSGSAQISALGFISSSFPYTGSAIITGSLVMTGSASGNVNALSISSQTASLNLNDGNFFTLQLVSGSVTRIEPSNIKAGQTVNILLSTTGSGTVTFPTSVKQISGSSYIPTTTTSKDIITLVSFDATSLYLVAAKNLA